MFELYNGDCLEIMKGIPDGSVDFILCDPPYGTTACAWDSVIPLDAMWAEYRRILKPRGVVALFSSQPFTAPLISSNQNWYKYTWYWLKKNKTNFANAKKQPMRRVEEINIFFEDRMQYFQAPNTREYLKSEREKAGLTHKGTRELLGNWMGSHYFTDGVQFQIPNAEAYAKLQTTGFFSMPLDELAAMYAEECEEEKKSGGQYGDVTYNPQGVVPLDEPFMKVREVAEGSTVSKSLTTEFLRTHTGYPDNVLEFDYDRNGARVHPTQKPVPLLEYLIKTYSNEGETVLDNTMGSGSTGVAALNTGRRFIGIEKEVKYFNTARRRIEELGG